MPQLDPTDLAMLLERWEAMSQRYLPGRARLVDALLGELRGLGPAAAILDVGCGPATLLAVIGDECPGVALTGIDHDPVLIELARAHLGALPCARIVDGEIDARWDAAVHGPYDAVVAMLVVHYFPRPLWPFIFHQVRTVLRPGGIVAIIEATGEPTHVESGTDRDDAPTWTDWWELAEKAAGHALRDAFERRAARSALQSAEHHPTIGELGDLLTAAGFHDVTLVDQVGPAYLVIATAGRTEP